MKIEKFEDIIAWQKGQDLAVEVHAYLKKCRDWKFRDQIFDASVSISSNIAEGFNRISNLEFRRFLYMSLGSCSEVKSLVYLAQRLDYLKMEEKVILLEKCTEEGKIITGLIKSLKTGK